MAGANDALDRVLDKLIRDVEQAVHALYRGDVRQQTAKARTDGHRTAARRALQELLAGAGPVVPAPAAGRPVMAGAFGANPAAPMYSGPGPADPFAARPTTAAGSGALTSDEATAITKCVMAWLPMGPPNTVPPDSRCVPAAKELAPSWQIRELAREAIRRLGPKS